MFPVKNQPLFLQVEEYLRSKILDGTYSLHEKLPSTRDLASLTGTSFCTVQAALAKLSKEGLIETRVGRGTYVRGKKTQLGCAGIYFNRPFARADSQFYQVLGQELRRRLGERHVKVRIWTDERDEAEQREPLGSLKQAMDRCEIQALIAPLICGNDLRWLRKVPVATAVLTTDMSVKTAVRGDQRGAIRKGLEALRDQGCRTVGLINAMTLQADQPQSGQLDFYRAFVEISTELGLQIRDEWIRFPQEYNPHFEFIGYEYFHALWNLSERPQGLLVYPDDAVSGVIKAILERRLNVPNDLKVVFHANDMLPYVCPFPATFLQTRVGDFADALIQMLDDTLAGKPCETVIPTFVVREGSPFNKELPIHTANKT